MPQYVVNLAVSADAGGGVGWLEGYDPAEMNFDAFLAGIDRMVMGAATYRQVLSFGVWRYGDTP